MSFDLTARIKSGTGWSGRSPSLVSAEVCIPRVTFMTAGLSAHDVSTNSGTILETPKSCPRNNSSPPAHKMQWTGLPDADREILSRLSVRDLAAACSASRYLYSLCNDDLWRFKLRRTLRLAPNEALGELNGLRRAALELTKNPPLPSKQLLWALERGHASIVKLLLDRGVTLDDDEDSMLRIAVSNDHYDITELLLDRGIDLHEQIDNALLTAVHWGRYSIIRLLLDRGANVNAKNDSVFRIAVMKGKKSIVELLLDRGASMEHTFGSHVTIIDIAAKRDYLDIILLFIERGMDIHTQNDIVLCYAVKRNHLELVKYILSVSGDYYRTPRQTVNDLLTHVVGKGYYEYTRLLLDAGVDVHNRND